jgi:hypothetical protein
MLEISRIVDVQITRQTAGVAQAGFSVPLILGTSSTGWGSDRIRSYRSISAVLEDFASSTAEYQAAAAIFSQSPRLSLLKIGREGARVAQVQTMTFSGALVTGNIINGTVDGVALAPVPFNTSNATTLSDLATAIQATPGVATAVSDGVSAITITSQNAGVPTFLTGFLVTAGATQPTAAIVTTVQSHGVAQDLVEITRQDSDWYGLIWTERTAAYVLEAARAIESMRRIFITAANDANILVGSSTTDIAYILHARNYNRTAVIYNSTLTDFADAAWMGKNFVYAPGSETWKFKNLAGITADNITESQANAATAKRANAYSTIGGIDESFEGTMASGEFIDVIRGVDWLQARIEEAVFGRLSNSTKVPYTNAGVAIIESEIRAVLDRAVKAQLLSEEAFDPDNDINTPYIVTVPRVLDVSFNDRSARYLPGITFNARLASAIHRVTIAGTVTV